MNATLFKAWFQDKFVPCVKKFCLDKKMEYKVLLLLDNAPAHPSCDKLTSRDGKPPNTTSILQPLDQGVLEAMKQCYKKYLLHHVIIENSASSLSIPDIVKGVTIRDAVYWVSQVWNEISEVTIKKSWRKLIPSSYTEILCDSTGSTSSEAVEQSSGNENFVDLYQDLGYSEGDEEWQTPQDWLAEDFTDPGYQLMSDTEIIAEVTRDDIDSDPESDVEIVLQPSVTHTQAFDAFQTALDWLEAQSDTDPSHLLLVRKWRDTAAQKRANAMKQTSLLSYFVNPEH